MNKKIGIIGAMACEVEPLIAQMQDAKQVTVGSIKFTEGVLCGKDTVIAICGIGKVFAAICAQTMILRYGAKTLINTGVAGTLSDKIGILDFAVSSGVVQHDMDTSAIGDARGLISGINIIEIPADKQLCERAVRVARQLGNNCIDGIVASGDQFINDGAKKSFIRDTFGAIACEMEGAAIGHAAYISGVPFVVIRCISDNASGEAEMEYPEMVKIAAQKSQALVEGMLRLAQNEG